MSGHKEFRIFSKILEREVDCETLVKFAFVEGCRYSMDELKEMAGMDPGEVYLIHAERMIRLAGF